MTPALQAAMTRSGPDTMSIGAATTGTRRPARIGFACRAAAPVSAGGGHPARLDGSAAGRCRPSARRQRRWLCHVQSGDAAVGPGAVPLANPLLRPDERLLVDELVGHCVGRLLFRPARNSSSILAAASA